GGEFRSFPMTRTQVRSSGLRAQVSPEGDCVEANMDAIGKGMGLTPLTCLQLVYNGVPIFYGELRVGGNPRDLRGHTHTIRSAALRLKEVQLSGRFQAPQQPAHLTVRAAIQDIIHSGQLGTPSTVLYDVNLCPDLGVELAPVRASNYQNAYALLEAVQNAAAARGVEIRFGVNADRKFFCIPANSRVLDITGRPITSTTVWKAPVSEVVVTAVRWFIAPARAGREGGQAPWITAISRSPVADTYGQRLISVRLKNGLVSDYMRVADDLTAEYMDGTGVYTLTPEQLATLRDGEGFPEAVGTGQAGAPVTYVPVSSGGTALTPVGQAPAPAPTVPDAARLGESVTITGEAPDYGAGLRLYPPVGTVAMYVNFYARTPVDFAPSVVVADKQLVTETPPPFVPVPGRDYSGWAGMFRKSWDMLQQRMEWEAQFMTYASDFTRMSRPPGPEMPPGSTFAYGFSGIIPIEPGSVVQIRVPGGTSDMPTPAAQLVVSEARAYQPEEFLTAVAKPYFRIPAEEPAEIDLRTILGRDELAGKVKMGDYVGTVAAYEYRLSSAGGMTMGVMTGQAEEPQRLAQAELIKYRDKAAVIEAITGMEAGA
ncbi:MAG: hypothetical protein Q4C67_05600, partial [Deinococcus sp.]|nr:hypothetical protein [Deinococcus sp.]